MQAEPFKIIIADDTPDNVDLLKRRLRSPNYTFYTAADGQEALTLTRSIAPDLILLDVNMPVMDGFEVCRRLRMNKNTRDIPVIIITAARISTEDQITGLGLGADDYLTKPFNHHELVARVARKLQVRELQTLRQRLTQSILFAGSMEMLVVNQEMKVVESGGNLADWLGTPADDLLDAPLLEVLPELFGYEKALTSITAGEESKLHLPTLNRFDNKGQIRYLDLIVQAYPDPKKPDWLLVLLSDVTEASVLNQKTIQQRNDLHLMYEKLSSLNHRLDYVLRHYVPADVVETLTREEEDPQPNGKLRHVTILFADMRGYTKLSRNLPPDKVMCLLNEYLHLASEAIAEFDGVIAQYIGDAIMAMFNAISDQPDHAWRATQAAMAIQKAVAAHSPPEVANGEAIAFGAGVFTGDAIIGNTGAKWQYIFSAIGHTTNMAYRLTMLADGGKTIIGEETYQAVKDKIKATPLPPVTVKGIDRPLPVYRVERLTSKTNS